MQILIVESDTQTRATLRARVSEGLRQAEINALAIVDIKEDQLPSFAFGTICGVILGPSCQPKLQELVEGTRAKSTNNPICIVLSQADYDRDAVTLTKRFNLRIFSAADLNQLTSFLIECENHFSLIAGRKNKNIIGVCHFKGGVGCTSLATALAACWARHGTKTALIDLDDVNPQVTTWARVSLAKRGATAEHLELGQVPESRISDICSPVETFNGNLAVVGQPEDYNTSFHFKANVLDTAPCASEFMHSILSALKSQYEVIVIDMARSWGLASFSVLPRCEKVLLVTDEDRTSVKRTFDCLNRLKKESDDADEFDLSKWHIVLNAYTGSLFTETQLNALIQEADLFPTQSKGIILPYSSEGRAWGEPGKSFYDLADPKTKKQIAKVAYDLVPYRTNETSAKSHSLIGKLNELVLGK